jgi:acetoin:2,6-dichlorophenolindophenol oxidoreductase subunit alpha
MSMTLQTPVRAQTAERLTEFYRRMIRIRRFEERARDLVSKGVLYGAFHTSIGQEASIVGTCMALERTDYMVGTHRSHGHPIGKGAALDRLLAELMGKVTGVNQGKGGSMHLSDFSVGSLGETSIVGSGLPVATGAALGSKLKGNGRVTVCFFGDGASSEGTFHESLNIAALWDLPVVFVCENNGYGELTATAKAVAGGEVWTKAAAYGVPGEAVDGQDVFAVHDVVARAVARARAGQGPSLVETKTYRYDNHAIGIPIENYRDAAEVEAWRTDRDPLRLVREPLLAQGLTGQDLDRVEQEVLAELDAAVEFATSSAEPDPDAAFTHVFTEPIDIRR